jgi:hypothetical protein
MIPGHYQVMVMTAGNLDRSPEISLTWRSAAGTPESRNVVYDVPF